MSTMTESQTRYTLEYINKVKMSGFDIKLPDDTISMVNKLAQLVGSPEYVRTPVFKKRSPQEGPRRGEKYGDEVQSGVTDADWEALKNYKVTETVPKDRTEDEQLKRNIITELRKMTDINYEEQQTLIITYLKSVKEDYYDEVASEIFNICCGNKFYADVYVKLYNTLSTENEIFKNILDKTHDSYLNEFTTIQKVDPNEDYDLFCDINKQNELRVAQTVFLAKILPTEQVESLVKELLTCVYVEMKKPDNVYIVEQYTENIYEMVSTLIKKNNTIDDENISASIGNITMLQPRSLPSLTNKIMFKFMDLDELIEDCQSSE